MKTRLFLIVIAMFSCIILFAQNEEKYSITTQLFLQDMAGNIDLNANTKASTSEKKFGLHPVVDPKMRKYDRFVAAPDTIDGQVFMSAFIHLKDNTNLSELEALGVKVQTAFGNGRITALIPVEKVEQVAALDNVTKIKAAQMMRPTTIQARQKTNVDDVLTQSADAIAAGLDKVYDGSGVILGVIDTGIDFNHIAFKDKNGNSRIKRAYVYNGNSAQFYNTINSTNLTDDNTEDHGTHTSSTAGGSSVTVNGSTVTVTDNHANAVYGGMAPGADLYLAGVNGLSDTYMTNALNDMVSYANAQGKPLVVSNSWGSHLGPHDGTGDWADLVNQNFGPNHPNRIILFASSNDAGKSQGGISVSGTASSASPLGTILRSHYYSDTDDGFHYEGILASAWARSTSVSTIQCKVHVLNSSTGALIASSNTVTPTTNGAQVTGLTNYYSGTLYALKDFVDANKTQILLYASSAMESKSYTSSYQSNYTLAVEFFPSAGSSVIDVWAGGYAYFTNHLTTAGHAWTNGSSDMSVSDEATISNAISIGAYVSRTDWRSAAGTNYSSADEYTMDDIAPFSSYALASKSPTGLQYPWITAPGARIASAVNHNHTKSVDATYSYYGNYFINDLVVNSTTNPYAMMEGTSMATPAAAGIVALWLQASMEENAVHKNLTVNDVKQIMQETAITDAFTTTGPNASHFGNGKIDALAGVQYILGASAKPTIKATPLTVEFDENTYATRSYTKTVNVRGLHLEGNITATLNGNDAFSIDKTTITQSNGQVQTDITITYAPTSAGTHTATITLSSTGADDVTVNITATAKPATPFIMAEPETLTFDAGLNENKTLTVELSSEFLTEGITVTLNDVNDVFSVSPTSIALADAGEASINVTFNSATEGTFTGTLVLSSAGAENVTINLSATASDGGSASNAYLNIAKYATIDEAGYGKTYVNPLYKYTEDTTNKVAWLTLPVYGAASSVVYSPKAQKWIKTSVTSLSNTSGNIVSVTWNANTPFQGSSTYFNGLTARALGTTINNSSSARTVTFYVTNTTEVKLFGYNGTIKRNNGSNSYPTTLTIYECTDNGDDTLTEGTAVVATVNGGTTTNDNNKNININIANLNANKIYKVVTSVTRGYLYEVAFKTPLPEDPELIVDPDELTFSTPVGVQQEQTFDILGENLKGNVTLTLDDANNVFSLSSTSATIAQAENDKTFTVSFNPSAEGTYNATITVSTPGLANQIVTLTGEATKGYIDLTVGRYGYATLYTDIPLAIPYNTYSGLESVYYASNFDTEEGKIYMTRIDDNIPELTGVIIKAEPATYRFPIATTEVTPLQNNLLQGTLVAMPTSEIEGTVMTMQAINGIPGFYRYNGTSLGANKVYVVIPTAQIKSISTMSIVVDNFDGTVTSIFGVADKKESRDEWFTLQGVRLNGRPVGKGIYIHNGQRVLVK